MSVSRLRRYFRLTLPLCADSPPGGDSFALIYSVEDAAGGADGSGRLAGVGAQLMGPGDSYFLRHGRATDAFWGAKHRLALGHTFEAAPGAGALAGCVGVCVRKAKR